MVAALWSAISTIPIFRLTSRPFDRLTLQTKFASGRRGGVDRESFDRLLLQHLSAAQRFAIRLAGDAHAAEDLLHDAIVRAACGCDGFRGHARFTTWLFQIIVNCFRDRTKARGTEEFDGEIADVRSSDPASAIDENELGRLVAQRVSSLPPRQREVMVLVVFENMSVWDAAEVLGISETNVRVNLSYARQRLKQELAGYLSENQRGI
jgi:RNA polymerase sigma-70 factor (ECF subfamily)